MTKPKQETLPAKHPRENPNKDLIIQAVLDGMALNGMSAFKACQAAGVPHSTFLRWVDLDPDLADRYARARDDLIERMANEVLDISDEDVGYTDDGKKDWAAVQKHKLRVDTRRWLLSKLAPKKYGDKTTTELTGANGGPVAVAAVDMRALNDQELDQLQLLMSKAKGAGG